MARKVSTRSLKNPIPVVVGAGITEQWYFVHLRDVLNLRLRIRPRYFGVEDIFQLDKKIVQILSQDSVVICVFDMDTVRNNPKERAKFDELTKKYSGRKDVIICDSMPSIEYWFLIHYEDTNRHFNGNTNVIQALVPHIPHYAKTKEFLQNQRWVADMVSDNKLNTAVSRAKSYSTKGDSYTNVYKAIEMGVRRDIH